jgi:hypothetical protein
MQCVREIIVDTSVSKDAATLLLDWSRGNQDGLNQLATLVCEELHRLGGRRLRRGSGDHTLWFDNADHVT